jgi:hypothetical protein
MNFKGMSTKPRDMYAKSSLEFANIVAGALVFRPFISGRSIDMSVFAAGIIITLGLHIGAYYFSKEVS